MTEFFAKAEVKQANGAVHSEQVQVYPDNLKKGFCAVSGNGYLGFPAAMIAHGETPKQAALNYASKIAALDSKTWPDAHQWSAAMREAATTLPAHA